MLKTLPSLVHSLGQLYAADKGEVAAVFMPEPFLSVFSPVSDLWGLGIGVKDGESFMT